MTKRFLPLCLSLLMTATLAMGEIRTLSNVSGQKIEAEILEVSGKKVRLRRIRDNQLFFIDIALFVKADQEYLRNFKPSPQGGSGAESIPEQPLDIPEKADVLLEEYCYSCHDEDVSKGDIRLDTLADLTLKERLDMLNRMQEQVYLKEMPPKKKKKQPSAAERKALVAWISKELHKYKASKLEDKLRYPSYGNYIDHEKLFSGTIKAAPYTPARRWLVSPQIFGERLIDIFNIDDRHRSGFQKHGFYGVTNPLVLNEVSGVRYYDNTTLGGGHLINMITNAEWISHKQIRGARVKKGEIKGDYWPDQKDRWAPRNSDREFEVVITSKTPPTDEQLAAAIKKQFQNVLRRPPSSSELSDYLKFTKAAVKLGGQTEGLRQMLVSVLLETEFLYRMEFGAGQPDRYGRKKLSPHEAAFAISYALGDRGPDKKLLEAAKEGKLSTREDYAREVKRLMADTRYYYGPVDQALTGKNMSSHEVSHPKLIRFFREFFGYTRATKIFKDLERSDGYYGNVGRGSAGTPGFLIKEADRIVDYYMQQDKKVFENILTTEKFFVFHDKSNEQGRKIIEQWRTVWNKFKNTDWKKNPEKVLDENKAFLEQQGRRWPFKNGKHKKAFLPYMYFWEESFGKGKTPFTTPSFQHGYAYTHSSFYNLPPTPGIFRYNREAHKHKFNFNSDKWWDYPVEQPFKIKNRKGILTHPAWLIAHASNFHTDPIKRGRWVREKLLAGRVPDIPITVDAQVPDDHHKTFRERVEGVTEKGECWKCHKYMNPLGYPFEAYDDFGRFRLDEPLEHKDNIIKPPTKKNGFPTYKTQRVNTKGWLDSTGNPSLDGPVRDAADMIERLAKSERVRQSIIRHIFRYFMGRNEMLSDSKTLIDADRAYVRSGGSFKAVVLSILTSDSFMYRK